MCTRPRFSPRYHERNEKGSKKEECQGTRRGGSRDLNMGWIAKLQTTSKALG